MDQEVIERLTRIETKIDSVIFPHIARMDAIEKDISFVKKAMAILGACIIAVGGWVATYFGSKS